jgi:hypothetical protein
VQTTVAVDVARRISVARTTHCPLKTPSAAPMDPQQNRFKTRSNYHPFVICRLVGTKGAWVFSMAIVRLPQTQGEIEAAAAEIIYTARHDRWSTNSTTLQSGSNRMVKEDEVVKDSLIEAWLNRSSKMGAMERKALAINIEITLYPWSEDVRKLGARRVVTIISRNRWRGARSADDFLASRT